MSNTNNYIVIFSTHGNLIVNEINYLDCNINMDVSLFRDDTDENDIILSAVLNINYIKNCKILFA